VGVRTPLFYSRRRLPRLPLRPEDLLRMRQLRSRAINTRSDRETGEAGVFCADSI
jgi:hypothetical protein